jgi:transposase
MTLIYLPPYSPELNQVEPLWDELREKFFANRYFNSSEAVAETLTKALNLLINDTARLPSLDAFFWIIEELGWANWH